MELSGLQRVILVTSSFHMPRAVSFFNKAGIEVIPYPTDFRSNIKDTTWLSLVPDAMALGMTSDGIREFIGRLYYRTKFLFEP